MILDAPRDMNLFNPKVYKQKRRSDNLTSHQHVNFNPSSDITTISWSSFIACRKCKYSIIEAIGLSSLQSIRVQLRTGQILGVLETTILLSSLEVIPSHFLPAHNYRSNSAEADMRIWRYATQTRGRHILIYSPYTDKPIL